jgi:hypothetical protein
MENRNEDKGLTKKARLSLVVIIVLVTLVIAAIVIIVSLLVKGSSSKDDDQPAAPQVRVCDSGIVEQYNEIMSTPPGGEDALEEKFDKLVNDVSSKEHVEKDSTCQYILLNYAITKLNAEGIEKHSQIIKELHNEGVFPDNALYYIMPMRGVDNYLESSNDELQDDDGHEGAGVY